MPYRGIRYHAISHDTNTVDLSGISSILTQCNLKKPVFHDGSSVDMNVYELYYG